MAMKTSFRNWASIPKASALTQSLKTPVWQGKVPRDHIDFYFVLGVFLATPRSMQDLSSQTRDRTHAPCSGSTES